SEVDAETPAALEVFGSSLTASELYFEQDGETVSIGGTNVSLLLMAGATRVLRVSDADFAFVFDASGIYGAMRNAEVEGPELEGFVLIGVASLYINTTGEARSVTVGGEAVELSDGGGEIYVRAEVGAVDVDTPATLEAFGSRFVATALYFEQDGPTVSFGGENVNVLLM